MLCIPPDQPGVDTPPTVYEAAAAYCVARRAMLILDPPSAWGERLRKGRIGEISLSEFGAWSLNARRNAAIYFPGGAAAAPLAAGPLPLSGAVAGVWARMDASRGVWKAPAGSEALLRGIAGLEAVLTDAQMSALNPRGINALRVLPGAGPVVWGARTLAGADTAADDYKYIPVRRTRLFIEESLDRGTRWAVFEPNDARLWARLRLSVGSFLHGLFRQGAFQGATPSAAYFVACDATTTTQADIDAGVVNIEIGFAPLKPPEFVTLTIRQVAGREPPSGNPE
jgi:phage tail sheath protein FI